MEPAFIIKHYAGKVKYGVKVGTSLLSIYLPIALKRGVMVSGRLGTGRLGFKVSLMMKLVGGSCTSWWESHGSCSEVFGESHP